MICPVIYARTYTNRSGATATLLPNGKVLVAGGFKGESTTISSAELYDPTTGKWTAIDPMTNIRRYHTATLLPEGKILVAGGYPYNGTNTAELYDPNTSTWARITALNHAREFHTASLLPNGKVLVAGGFGGDSLSSAELYNSTNGLVTAIILTNTAKLISGEFQFTFTNIPIPGATFTVFVTTNLEFPFTDWSRLGGATDIAPGQFQFVDLQAENNPQRFYRVKAP